MQAVGTKYQTARHTLRRSLVRALCVVAAATLPQHTPAQGQTTVVDASARVIIKYKPTSSLLKAAGSAAEKPAAQAKAMSERTGLALRAGAPVDDRSHVVLAEGITSVIWTAGFRPDYGWVRIPVSDALFQQEKSSAIITWSLKTWSLNKLN